jgi:hypothetical protein
VATAGKFVAAGVALGVLGGVALYGYWTDFDYPLLRSVLSKDTPVTQPRGTPLFRCDGRSRCEQMTSCEEAMFFLKNCKPIELDKDKDGIPCEVQWCQK